MKPRFSILAALLISAVFSPPLLADNSHDDMGTPARGVVQPLSEGTVKKLSASGKIIITHGPLVNLGMSPMTMTFGVKDKALLKGVKPGDKVRFRAEQSGDSLIVTQLTVIH